jgi:hypothetical protein
MILVQTHNKSLNIIRFAHLDAPKAARQLIQRYAFLGEV